MIKVLELAVARVSVHHRTFSSCSSSSVSTPSLGTEDDGESAASTEISPPPAALLADFILEVSTPLMVLGNERDAHSSRF